MSFSCLKPLCDLTRKLCAGRAQVFPYLILLHVEFSCFHPTSSLMTSRSRSKDQSRGLSLCSTGPHLAVEGNYPLRCPVKSGLSSATTPFGWPSSNSPLNLYKGINNAEQKNKTEKQPDCIRSVRRCDFLDQVI